MNRDEMTKRISALAEEAVSYDDFQNIAGVLYLLAACTCANIEVIMLRASAEAVDPHYLKWRNEIIARVN